MKVLEYLKTHTLEELQEELGIKVSQNELYPELYCLNYDQINSPKLNPIVKECRSLVLRLEENNWQVESRSFDRFFNYGEVAGQPDDIENMVAYQKIDGSLVSVWKNEKYGWLYRTRSMIMPSGDNYINGYELSWKELIEEVINFDALDDQILDFELGDSWTWVFEVVSPENRVVTKYDEKGAYLITCRNRDGSYSGSIDIIALDIESEYPESFTFTSIDQCVNAAKHLQNFEEGYVLYKNNKPIMKVKSPAYLAAHRLRGETRPTPKRIMDMLFINEQDEYLAIFPEDKPLCKPYQKAFNAVKSDYITSIGFYMGIQDQKEFAMKIKHKPIAGLLFTKRKNKDLAFNDVFDNLFTSAKYKIVESYL